MATDSIQFGQRQRLTVQLNSLVRKYPRGVGIFKQFLQNADDGGASRVSMTFDKRSFAGSNLPHPKLSELLGPSLVVVNDNHSPKTTGIDPERDCSLRESGKQYSTEWNGSHLIQLRRDT